MFHQHVTITTLGDNTLDRVYTNRRGTYRATPRLHLCSSDHIPIILVPAYCPVLSRGEATQKTITVWPTEAVPLFQVCFETTAWQMFREAGTEGDTVNLEEYTLSVLGYIKKYVQDFTTTKAIVVPPNQKPWLNAEVRCLLRAQDAAIRARGADALRAAPQSLTAGINRAKSIYAQKI